ncbi:hypothetical protein P12x_000097 [Tundrisphaera lichenicola]|uniref:hypothetical protein n=1 Tax=Tundrisphaera lichenicola TaxID=2029860 RepID=UPI003EBD2B53
MGFKAVRQAMIQALKDGHFQHEERAQAEGKNLLASGEVSVEEVIGLLLRCTGKQHQTSLHHADSSQVVHIFKPTDGPSRWYIKGYLIEQDGFMAIFISVHQ